MKTISVDVWSDIVCPWCYIGTRNLDTALARFEHRSRVEVRWHSFELDPQSSAQPRLTLPERHRQDMAGTTEQARQRIGMVAALAAEAGLTYDLDRAMPVNSFDAHRVMKLADRSGSGDAVRERLMRAYTAEGAILSDHDTLIGLAGEAGLDAETTRAMLRSADLTDAVRDDESRAHAAGVSGVPTFLVAGRYLLAGGQRPEAFTRLLQRADAETQHTRGEAGGMCTSGGSC